MDLVSVIVPVYNVEQYLHQCIDSLIGQTYQPLEIILVNDGSKDNSDKICNEYASKYSNIQVIHKENAGLGMARNTGLKYATGEYVTFLDSDDYADKVLIENLYKGIKKYKVDVCKGGFKRITDEGKVISITQYPEEFYEDKKAALEFAPRLIGSLPDKKDSMEMCVCGTLYKTLYIKEHDIQFPSERIMISEDLVFNLEYMQYAKGACSIVNSAYNYRVNTSSLTRKYRADRFQACCFYYKEMKKKIEQLGYKEIEQLRLKRMFFIYILMCVSQEKKQISGFSIKKSLKNIWNICSDETVQKVIRSYPVNKLEAKQKIFIYILKFKLHWILYLCGICGII